MFHGDQPSASAKGVRVRQAHAVDRRRIERRFLCKMQVGDDCWEWQGKRSNGYGYFSLNGKYVKAARFAYEMFIGPIPEGLQLDHLCRNRACCKPWHLEPVTNRVNGLRGVSPCAVNVAKTECPKGHPYDAANTVIAANGWRKCRECNRIAMRARQARKVASRSAGR